MPRFRGIFYEYSFARANTSIKYLFNANLEKNNLLIINNLENFKNLKFKSCARLRRIRITPSYGKR